jgi:hypothetical protein
VIGPVAYLSGTAREHVIDPETLHDVPTHPAELAEWVAAARDVPLPRDLSARRRHHTEVGVAARLIGELGLAESELATAAELAPRESPAVALRARIRLAQVWHWQGRYAEAMESLADCVADAAAPADRAFAHHYAGLCAYDTGDVDRAAGHFQAALRWRVASGAARTEVEASRLGLDSADACRTAIAMAAELDRLVPAAHHRIRDALVARGLLPERPPHFGVLVELRCLLLDGPVGVDVVAGLFRHQPRIDRAVGDLVAGGWLVRSAGAIAATSRCMSVLVALMTAAGSALVDLWGAPRDELDRVDEVVAGALGTSAGPVFDALATVDTHAAPAVRLFDRCNALRHHRADGHAAAWWAVGLTPTAVAHVPPHDPVRRQVETATNRIAARPYRPLSTPDRAELVALLRALPGQPPVLP